MANRIENLLNKAVALIDPSGGVHGSRWNEYARILYVLGNQLQVPGYRSNNSEKRGIIAQALKTLPRDGSATKDMMEARVEAEKKRAVKQPQAKYEVLFTINLENSAEELFSASFRIVARDMNFRFVKGEQALAQYKVLERPTRVHRLPLEYEDNLTKYAFCLIEAYGATPRQAILDVHAKFEAARAWVNFALQALIVTSKYPPGQLSRVSPSYLIWAYDGTGKLKDVVYTIGEYEYKRVRLALDEVQRALGFLEYVLRSPKGALLKQIKSTIPLYGDAMDNSICEYRFLHLWQALEVVLGTSDSAEIQNRVKGIFNNDLLDMTLGAMLRKRNIFIHKSGPSDFTETDTQLLQNLVDNLVLAMLRINADFRSSAQLDEVWQFLPLDIPTLERKRAILQKILETRTSAQGAQSQFSSQE